MEGGSGRSAGRAGRSGWFTAEVGRLGGRVAKASPWLDGVGPGVVLGCGIRPADGQLVVVQAPFPGVLITRIRVDVRRGSATAAVVVGHDQRGAVQAVGSAPPGLRRFVGLRFSKLSGGERPPERAD